MRVSVKQDSQDKDARQVSNKFKILRTIFFCLGGSYDHVKSQRQDTFLNGRI